MLVNNDIKPSDMNDIENKTSLLSKKVVLSSGFVTNQYFYNIAIERISNNSKDFSDERIERIVKILKIEQDIEYGDYYGYDLETGECNHKPSDSGFEDIQYD